MMIFKSIQKQKVRTYFIFIFFEQNGILSTRKSRLLSEFDEKEPSRGLLFLQFKGVWIFQDFPRDFWYRMGELLFRKSFELSKCEPRIGEIANFR